MYYFLLVAIVLISFQVVPMYDNYIWLWRALREKDLSLLY